MWDYTDKVKEHFLNPRNVGEIGDADAVGEVGSLACGDALKLFLKLDESKERIVDAKFQTFGCGSAIASSSALTEMIKGKTLDEALQVTNKEIADFLGGLPEEKMHCSVMGQEALEVAIAKYRGGPVPVHDHEHMEGEIVCKCFGLTDQFLKKVIAGNRLHTAEQVTHFTKAGGACGGCIPKIKELIAEVLGEQKKEEIKRPEKLTNLRKMQLIQEVLENEVRPQLWADGGDLELIDIDGGTVKIAFRKACAGCASSGYTARFVEQKLREMVAEDITVEEVEGVIKEIYFDNNATTKVDEAVFEEMRPYFCELYGNPSSMHYFGGQVQKKVDEARVRVATLLGAQTEEIIFTACGTESDNAAIRSALEVFPERRHIITTRVEHPAVLTLCRNLTKKGYRVTELNVDGEGRLDLNELKSAVDRDTAVVSVMYANNETGVIFPVEEVGRIVKEKGDGALFHTDAVQAVGKIPLNMASSTIDLLSLSGHKLHAPKGIGALYLRKGVPFRPFMVGGHQERSRRAGTENTASIIALGKACELAGLHLDDENSRVKNMRDRLQKELLALIPHARINGGAAERLPNTLSIAFEYVEGEAILLLLSEKGICASSGSACTSGSLEPSHVLRAMGVPFTCAHGSIRFSISRFNTDAEIELIIKELPPIIQRLREISPFGRELLNK